MSTLLQVIAPVFGIMVLGFLAVRGRVLDGNHIRGLVLFVFNFAIPVLLFRGLAEMEVPERIPWEFLLAFYGASLAVFAAGMGVGRIAGRDTADQAIFGMGAGFSNTVLVGIPVVLTAFGEEAALPLYLIIAFQSPLLMPLTIGIIQGGRSPAGTGGIAWKAIAGEVVRNPILWGLGLGALANLAGFTLPGPLDRMAELLGDASIPCALFALGGSLASYPLAGDVPPALALSGLKLVLHPILVWILAVPVFGLSGLWVAVAVLMAGLPTGVNVYLFGARYEAAAGVAARTVLLTTVASMATVSVLLLVL